MYDASVVVATARPRLMPALCERMANQIGLFTGSQHSRPEFIAFSPHPNGAICQRQRLNNAAARLFCSSPDHIALQAPQSRPHSLRSWPACSTSSSVALSFFRFIFCGSVLALALLAGPASKCKRDYLQINNRIFITFRHDVFLNNNKTTCNDAFVQQQF